MWYASHRSIQSKNHNSKLLHVFRNSDNIPNASHARPVSNGDSFGNISAKISAVAVFEKYLRIESGIFRFRKLKHLHTWRVKFQLTDYIVVWCIEDSFRVTWKIPFFLLLYRQTKATSKGPFGLIVIAKN